MTKSEILKELNRLPLRDKLLVLESAIQKLREEFQKGGQGEGKAQVKMKLSEAAKALLKEYRTNSELTCFTALDGEDFDAPR